VPLAGHQQQRFAGDLPYKPNKYIESWGHAREHVELNYKFDKSNLSNIGKWVIAFPILVYMLTKSEYNKSDKKYGREPRDFM
jgi:hypothetical protein